MVGCGGGLRLTITSSEGGTITVPGEGTFTYNEGTVVDLVAEADAGYRFVDWTGYVRAIANVTAAATNITMNDSYSITANFALDICHEIQDWYDLYAIKDNLCVSYILMNDLDSTTPGYEELASPTANGGRAGSRLEMRSTHLRAFSTVGGMRYATCLFPALARMV